jgi:serine protease Do
VNATWKLALIAVVASLLGSCGAARPAPRSRLTPKEIVANSKPAIVRIEVGPDRVGTGFVIDKTGLIATNFHVVVGSDDIKVTMLDGTKYPVRRIVGFDPAHDLALLDIDPTAAIPVLLLGDSGSMSPGDPVLAIGNPLGVLDYTVSDGLLSAVRVVSPELTLLQISAPISQGSSGGPLFNSYGEVVGIVNAFLSGGQNLNFAIPTSYLKLLAATTDPPMTTADFKVKTTSLAQLPPTSPSDEPDPEKDAKIVRKVANHDLKVLDGCGKNDLADAANAIGEAIEMGAPLYNEGSGEDVKPAIRRIKFGGCFQIYADVSNRLVKESPCRGIRDALSVGLERAVPMVTFKEKAWALRDAFDGVLDVIIRKARLLNPGTP